VLRGPRARRTRLGRPRGAPLPRQTPQDAEFDPQALPPLRAGAAPRPRGASVPVPAPQGGGKGAGAGTRPHRIVRTRRGPGGAQTLRRRGRGVQEAHRQDLRRPGDRRGVRVPRRLHPRRDPRPPAERRPRPPRGDGEAARGGEEAPAEEDRRPLLLAEGDGVRGGRRRGGDAARLRGGPRLARETDPRRRPGPAGAGPGAGAPRLGEDRYPPGPRARGGRGARPRPAGVRLRERGPPRPRRAAPGGVPRDPGGEARRGAPRGAPRGAELPPLQDERVRFEGEHRAADRAFERGQLRRAARGAGGAGGDPGRRRRDPEGARRGQGLRGGDAAGEHPQGAGGEAGRRGETPPVRPDGETALRGTRAPRRTRRRSRWRTRRS